MPEYRELQNSEYDEESGKEPVWILPLDLALALTSQNTESDLCNWLLSMVASHWQPQGAILGLADSSGRQLLCQGQVAGDSIVMALDVDDFSHPLAYALHENKVHVWPSLNGGTGIEHLDFQQMLSGLGPACGLYAIPVLSDSGTVLGTLALLDIPERLQHWHDNEEGKKLVQIFCNQMVLLRQRSRGQHEQSMLSASVKRARDEAYQQAQIKRIQAALIGQSLYTRALQQKVGQAAGHSLSVLILGETGTGKDVVARLLHQCSVRAEAPFVAINCAAIPENLIESELFGYQKGAFSDALSDKVGLVAQANGGTLFLDEVGDMPLAMQAKLLRVLETRCFRPLGAEQEIHSDFRLIAATHHSLKKRISDGAFRQDLYHRLCQCVLHVAPLRERTEDIPLLCRHFIELCCRRDRKAPVPLESPFLRQLMQYGFPGNVRELRNLMEVACAHTSSGQQITMQSLPPEAQKRLTSELAQGESFLHIADLRLAVCLREATILQVRLRQFGGDRQAAADSLNMPRRSFNRKCLKLGIRY
ncbi:sigma-54-dependent Fis family transcriptional regulator [Pectobacterium aroidearum]|uniref:Sigma-54-dependent Fis family transcriptional regulator n=1 Tax=Pectobacterium aroidearum TaxID=1201031 RepID=A0ABR5ZHY2_9GAMM|nr:sigma-54 dependent transcriptional regulator [Pectobacterium aroidearum]MBA5201392.1 sigma-54-dependent Fis family transcriptional regulator [Pectobacterium aroidearum]MBA5234110.1 sigma-54-dependent Fis family transcriptional regulator [Pectobacterium aroidearum]MBA5739302.1 sigma-54-dependent Fis family transcriptional regulator [Pectobacterium aroidearum]